MRRISLCVFALLLIAGAPRSRADETHSHGDDPAGKKPQATATPTPAVRNGNGTRITFPSSPGEASGYLALPVAKGTHAAVIVIQEWWGLNDWITANTERFASLGYVALAVDLYRGKSTADPSVAHELMRGMPEDRALADLKAAFNLLSTRPDVDPKRIGVIGWCMGGGYALALATAEPRLASCVINYGRLVTDPATIAKLQGPVLGDFGDKDQGITPQDVQAFRDALKAAGKDADIKSYSTVGHGFMNPNNTGGYDATAANDAWKRIDAFFSRTLVDRK